MFDVGIGEHGEVFFAGRLNAAQAGVAESFLAEHDALRVIDFERLEYISSVGLGVLLKVQKRLMATGSGLTLVNVSPVIQDVFRYSGFDKIIKIEAGSG